ncbi:hypothetical protein ACWDR2_13145 [Streptomyces sp. NPDC003631]|uniref:Uncharacterized protein n=2 Tax=Streptomyces TaxID=1883 RepID=A0ABP7L8M0_9ACTN
MPDLQELDAALPALLHRSPAEVLAEIEEAQRAAAAAYPPEPSIIPPPEHVYPWGHLWWWRFLAFPCVLRCGWAHIEDLVRDDLEPFVMRIGESPREEISQGISEHAVLRNVKRRRRIEAAIRRHAEQAHTEQAHHAQEPYSGRCEGTQ